MSMRAMSFPMARRTLALFLVGGAVGAHHLYDRPRHLDVRA